MRPRTAKFLLLTLLFAPALLPAKTSDRQQEIHADSDNLEGDTLSPDGKAVYSRNVVVTQGTLMINADVGTLQRHNGYLSLATFTGKPVKFRQQQDDGTWVDGQSDRLDYDVPNNNVILIGNYTLTSPKGSSSGQRMTYNTETGIMQSGNDGTRVHTVIKPKTAQGTTTVGAPQPVQNAAPNGAAPSTPATNNTDKH